MSLYGAVFARIYDPFLALGERSGMRDLRAAVLAEAHGSVLEIGAGTGLNLSHYPDDVVHLTLTDPEEPMLAKLRDRLTGHHHEHAIVRAGAEELPFKDDSFDTVVSTLVLCTVTDVDRALAEIRRVLRPDGRLLFIEHVRAEDERLSTWQDRLHGPWLKFGYGCHCNRDTHAALKAAGFEEHRFEKRHWPMMPPIVRPLLVGVATPTGTPQSSAGTPATAAA